MRDFSRRAVLGGLLTAPLAGGVQAAEWPSKPVQWVVPFPAGGANDVFARALAKPISQYIGQPVVIDNRGGAGGTVGAAAVARADADGHTLLVANTSHTYAPLVYPQA